MFDSRQQMAADIAGLLEGLRQQADGSYACIVEPGAVLFESPGQPGALSPEGGLRRLLIEKAGALFGIPGRLSAEGPMDDVFEGWQQELFLAFVNRRVALVVCCPEAEPMREAAARPLRALADRLLRWNPAWRMDEAGRGFFFGRAKLDVVVIGRPAE